MNDKIKDQLPCIACDARRDLANVSPSLALTTGLAMAVAFQQKAMLKRDMMSYMLCKKHNDWFEQEFKVMMDNAPQGCEC